MTTIFDCSLRDASYAVDFKISAAMTQSVVTHLDALNIPYIEVGHGMGVGGSRIYGQPAGATDEEYVSAGLRARKQAKVGVFSIPGQCTFAEVYAAVEQGIDFVRVGITPETLDVATGLMSGLAGYHSKVEVFPFLMGASTWRKEAIEKTLQVLNGFPCTAIYFVDSAGHLYGDSAHDALNHFTKHSTKRMGFHGHDNLGMAVANSLEASSLGFEFVDGTLAGIGRLGGNAPTEILHSLLGSRKINETHRMLSLASGFAADLKKPYDYWKVALGLTGTHSRELAGKIMDGMDKEALLQKLFARMA